jgi:multimeric flavodoxin WrbA
MKVVAFNGSARAEGNTAILLNVVLDALRKEGIETELVTLAGKDIPGCRACYKCFEKADGHCAVTGDIVNECIDKMRAADGILLGSPTYFSNVTAGMKALIERAGMPLHTLWLHAGRRLTRLSTDLPAWQSLQSLSRLNRFPYERKSLKFEELYLPKPLSGEQDKNPRH